MIHVITNSRQFAIEKLMSTYGMSPPFANLNFVTCLDDFNAIFTSEALPEFPGKSLRRPHPSASPALVIWQRGRMNEDARTLRMRTRDAFALNFLRNPTSKEME